MLNNGFHLITEEDMVLYGIHDPYYVKNKKKALEKMGELWYYRYRFVEEWRQDLMKMNRMPRYVVVSTRYMRGYDIERRLLTANYFFSKQSAFAFCPDNWRWRYIITVEKIMENLNSFPYINDGLWLESNPSFSCFTDEQIDFLLSYKEQAEAFEAETRRRRFYIE